MTIGRTTRRSFLKGGVTLGASAAVPSSFFINHAWAQDVMYGGEVFDAEGATLNIGEWGGGWEEFVRKALTDQFEADFNCKINWDSSFPWFPKFVTQGAQDPVYDICNWNLPNLTQTKQAGDFFLTTEEVKANVGTVIVNVGLGLIVTVVRRLQATARVVAVNQSVSLELRGTLV